VKEKNPYWAQLAEVLYESVPARAADDIRELVARIVEFETAEANKLAAEATELMMQGEALRDQMKLDAILHGAYDHMIPKKSS
jgi:hypothetical protein